MRKIDSRAPAGLSNEVLGAVNDFVAKTLGLHFPADRRPFLERGIAAVAEELALDLETYVRKLLSADFTRDDLSFLASHLTIGETYFFRDTEGLGVVERQLVRRSLAGPAAMQHPLRIWSAGCCTGEEPYTIAMMVDGLLGATHQPAVTILASDVNPKFIARARAGVYRPWSLRTTPDAIRRRYFASRPDASFELDSTIRERVAFFEHNLLDETAPGALSHAEPADVIVCRNVLMYLTPERAEDVVHRFFQLLSPGGSLIVGPSESSNPMLSAFSAVQLSGAVIYEKPVESQPGAAAGRLLVPDPAALGAALPHEIGAGFLIEQARHCADQRDFAGARSWCDRAIAANRMNPQHHYLLATIFHEQGQHGAALDALRTALYIDSGFVPAHFALANSAISLGRGHEAKQHLVNVLRTLRVHEPDEVLSEMEGLTAGRLMTIVQSLMKRLPGQQAAS